MYETHRTTSGGMFINYASISKEFTLEVKQ